MPISEKGNQIRIGSRISQQPSVPDHDSMNGQGNSKITPIQIRSARHNRLPIRERMASLVHTLKSRSKLNQVKLAGLCFALTPVEDDLVAVGRVQHPDVRLAEGPLVPRAHQRRHPRERQDCAREDQCIVLIRPRLRGLMWPAGAQRRQNDGCCQLSITPGCPAQRVLGECASSPLKVAFIRQY